mgnify:CR=1 FL=1
MKSKRNKLAGKHPSYKKRGMTPAQIKKKNEYQKRYNKTKSAVKHRVELNKENRKRGTYGNGDGKDVSHSSDGKKLRLESQSKNRARKTGKKASRSPRQGKKK